MFEHLLRENNVQPWCGGVFSNITSSKEVFVPFSSMFAKISPIWDFVSHGA